MRSEPGRTTGGSVPRTAHRHAARAQARGTLAAPAHRGSPSQREKPCNTRARPWLQPGVANALVPMNPITPRALRALSCSLLLPLALPAQLDDRENENPTGWVWYTAQTPAQVASLIGTGLRLIDVDVIGTSPLSFDVVAVQNSGSHYKAWAWYYDQTWSQVVALLSTNSARPIDVEGYDTASGRRYAVVMVNNSGANHWQFWPFSSYTASSVNSLVGATSGRLIDLDSWDDNGTRRYDGIIAANSVANARSWSYYYGVSSAFVGQQLDAGWRTYDLERIGTDQFNVVFTSGGPPARSWTVIGVDSTQLADIHNQNGARIVGLERYVASVLPLRWGYNAVLVNNSNELTTRVGDLLRNGSDGVSGVYLRQLGGSVLANLNENRAFEPASTIKTLFHVHAMREVAQNRIQLSTQIPSDFREGSPCWYQASNTTSRLDTVLGLMMGRSDNGSTIAIQDRFTNPAIRVTAAELQMGATLLLRDKCPGPLNESTLVDFGKLHEGVANGYLVTQHGDFTSSFRGLMLGSVFEYASTAGVSLGTIIDQEANSLGVAIAARNEFHANVAIAHKGGFYDRSTVFHGSQFAWLRLPFRNGPVIRPREYVTGAFVDYGTNRTATGDTTNLAAREVLRDVVRAALSTWTDYTAPQLSHLGNGCAGSLGVPSTSIQGLPLAGESISYRLGSVPALTTAICQIGLSHTSWNGVQLPYNLQAFGASSCWVRTDIVVSLPYTTTFNGTASFTLAIPPDAGLIGATYYHQWWIVDRPANALGLILSAGFKSVVGGYR